MEISNALKEYGLSENEINVYITLIRLGESSVNNISKSSSLPRTTCYNLLESLEQKGLVGFVVKDSKKYFSAFQIDALVKNLEEKKRIIEEIVPQLKSISKSINEKPQVNVFEGVKGVRSILKDVLDGKKIIYHYGDIISLQKVFAHVFPQFVSERIKRKIPIKIIGKREAAHDELLKNAKKELREFVFIPNEFHFDCNVFIYSNKVVIFHLSQEPYFAVFIEDKDFYNTQRNFFELLWKAYR